MRFLSALRLSLLAFLLCSASLLGAQSDDSPSPDSPSRFADHLWYGGSFVLGFGGSSFQSLFQVGISPMVGYKITPAFSIGPRASATYNYFRSNANGQRSSVSAVTWSGGVFARAKIIPIIFGHVEYSYESQLIGVTADGEAIRRNRGNAYVGLGYTQPNERGLGYEILILLNVNQADYDVDDRWKYRLGFNYNF